MNQLTSTIYWARDIAAAVVREMPGATFSERCDEAYKRSHEKIHRSLLRRLVRAAEWDAKLLTAHKGTA